MRRKPSERTSSIVFIVVVVCLIAIAVVLAFQPFPSSAALSPSVQLTEETIPTSAQQTDEATPTPAPTDLF